MEHHRQNIEGELAAIIIVTAVIAAFSIGTVGVFIWVVNNMVRGVVS